MNFGERSIPSSVILIGIVIALAAVIGYMLPLLGATQLGGGNDVAKTWSVPEPTSTQPAAARPSPADPGTALAATEEARIGASSGSKMAYIVLDTATPTTSPQASRSIPPGPAVTATLIPQGQPYKVSVNLASTAAAVPVPADVPRWRDRIALTDAPVPGTTLFDPLVPAQPLTLSVSIPVIRRPAGALQANPPAAAPTNVAPPRVPPTPSSAAAPDATQPTSPSHPIDGELVRAVMPPVPQLISPPAEARLAGMVTFEWRPAADLPRGMAYEIVVWSPGQDPGQARGIAPATIMTTQQINLDPLFESGLFRSGNLYWTVLVVQREPYLRLTAPGESEARYLVRRSGD